MFWKVYENAINYRFALLKVLCCLGEFFVKIAVIVESTNPQRHPDKLKNMVSEGMKRACMITPMRYVIIMERKL